jgi:hypothetical protein
VSTVFGGGWALAVVIVAGILYFKLGDTATPQKKHTIQILAFGFVYAAGSFAVIKAEIDAIFTMVALTVEVLTFTYFHIIGTKKF